MPGTGDFEILLDAHIDRVGLLVRSIDDNGFLLVDKVGGIDPRVLVGSEVTVMGKRALPGVICSTPPHLQKGGESKSEISMKELAVDIGLSKAQAQELVEIGDRVTFLPNQAQLLGTRIVSSAFDDRAGVAALLLTAELVKDKLSHCRVRLQLASQEETGGSGAKTSAFTASPDASAAVSVLLLATFSKETAKEESSAPLSLPQATAEIAIKAHIAYATIFLLLFIEIFSHFYQNFLFICVHT